MTIATIFQTNFYPDPIAVGSPVMTGLSGGVAVIGSTVTAEITGGLPLGAVQWLQDGSPISGQTAITLVVPDADGAELSVTIDGRESATHAIRYPLPQAAGSLADQSFARFSGLQSVDVTQDFTFAGTPSYTLRIAPSGVTIGTQSGVVSFDTNAMASLSAAPVVVRLADAGDGTRFAESGFDVTIQGSNMPEAFSPSDWSISDLGTGEDALLVLSTLPQDGGFPIQIVQYSLDGGSSWTPIGGTNQTGSFPLSNVFTDGVPTEIRLRAVNQNGAGPASAPKIVTTTAPGDWSITDHGDGTFTVTGAPAALSPPVVLDNGDGTFDIT